MNNVIVVASGKGGTGKSTVSVCLSVALVKQNKKVLLIDCDCGMRGLDIMLDISEDIIFDCADAVSGNCGILEAIYESKNFKNLHLMSAPFDAENEVSPEVFGELVETIKRKYDYIIIDSPAGVGSGFETAAYPAQLALVVTNAEPTSLRGAVNVRKKLEEMHINNRRLVINRFDKDNFYSMDFYEDLDEVIDNAGIQLAALVPYDNRLSSIVQKGGTGLVWSPAVTVFDCLAKRIQGYNIPLAFK